ncbi:MAG: hypothetical protein AB7E80_16400 [Hyphomicrobiaceae bacterium]
MSIGIILGSRPRSAIAAKSAMKTAPLPQAFRLGAARIPNEYYPTPPEATRALLSVERFDGSIWEPACGEGAIASVLTEAGHSVVATDLVDYGYGIPRVNFLKETRPRARHIVTNPPYGSGLADAFIEHSLAFARETRGTVAMLLNLSSLAHRTRTRWWQAHPPARLYAIDDIVCWPERQYGPPPTQFTRHRYFWAVWTPNHEGPSAFWWLSSAEFRHRQSVPNNNTRSSAHE